MRGAGDAAAGLSADTIRAAIHAPVAAQYRARGLTPTVTLDATDGLDRSAEAPALVAAGRSLTEAPIRQLYRSFALAVWRRMRLEHLVVAAEVNAIRVAESPALDMAVRDAAVGAAADLGADGSTARLSISLSVEYPRGRDGSGVCCRPATDVADFRFVYELGLGMSPPRRLRRTGGRSRRLPCAQGA